MWGRPLCYMCAGLKDISETLLTWRYSPVYRLYLTHLGHPKINSILFLRKKFWQPQIFFGQILKAMDFLDAVKTPFKRNLGARYDFWVTMVADTITEEAYHLWSLVDGCWGVRSTWWKINGWSKWGSSIGPLKKNRHGWCIKQYLYLSGRVICAKSKMTTATTLNSRWVLNIGTDRDPYKIFITLLSKNYARIFLIKGRANGQEKRQCAFG